MKAGRYQSRASPENRGGEGRSLGGDVREEIASIEIITNNKGNGGHKTQKPLAKVKQKKERLKLGHILMEVKKYPNRSNFRGR